MKIAFMMLLAVALPLSRPADAQSQAPTAKTANGVLEGVTEASGIRSFKGVPFAQPPVGDLRWKEPQPVRDWTGIRKADQFGPKPMQLNVFGDMNSRSKSMSEDCLYLNVWTPAKSAKEKRPVLVYFYGGGWVAGDGSEPRYDGESMAQKGIVAVTVNYRLGVFGYMSHPEFTRESEHHASGNYGYLDQREALRWVRANIAAFGGDPNQVTIAGESAGSCSVSAQMASPLSKGLFHRAIGESGSLLAMPMLPPVSLENAEKAGAKFGESLGATTLTQLRALPAEQLLKASGKPGIMQWTPVVDGYFFPKSPLASFTAGEQAKVPLLVGWNSQEMGYQMILGKEQPTVATYTQAVEKRFGERAPEVLKLYAATDDASAEQAATDLASDGFLSYCTWKWADLHSKTSNNQPVYRYYYSRPRPAMRAEMGNASAGLAGGVVKNGDASAPKVIPPKGAVHSAEIEYAMGNLATNLVYDWTPDDYKVSKVMQAFFANFIKTGDPNASGLPVWKPISGEVVPVMHIDVNTRSELEKNRGRYLFWDKSAGK